jgi:hypothetical protein
MTDVKRKPTTKIKRAISLSAKLDGDLVELCEYLGISTHAYLVSEAAKAIQRDRLTFLAKNSMEQMTEQFRKLAEQE